MRWRLPMRLDAAKERPLDPVQAWTAERERVHRARALRLVLPVVPPLLVLVLIIGGVVGVPRDLPEIALWLIVLTLYARMWTFLVRDARRLADEAAAVDQWFRNTVGDVPLADDRVVTINVGDDEGDIRAGHDGPVIALVGRPIDELDASAPRFPLTAVGEVRERLDRYMARVRPSAVVCSAASGADLLALDVAEARGVRRRVVLPYDRGRFRHGAVTDRPGTWGPLFDRILGRLPSEDLVVLGDREDGGADDNGGVSAAVNAAIHDHAATLAAALAPAARAARSVSGAGGARGAMSAAGAADRERKIVAVLVWEGRSAWLAPTSPDPVADFRALAERRGIRIDQILTTA